VSELTPAGPVPVAGVELYCDSCGSPTGHTFTYTDDNGFYSFGWTPKGVHSLFIWKDGYDVSDPPGLATAGPAVRNATVTGDTRFDVQLKRR
jgi:hypothetical protein